jgi:N-methylhydantoinase A/acetophenone carboxylase
MYTIDIDIGGTFTDGFFTQGGQATSCKVPTTPHDLTVCFLECIQEGANSMGVPLPEMLQRTAVVRLSTTVGTNAIINKSGPRLGLIVTKGYEGSLYGGDEPAPVLDSIVPREMIVGVEEEIDASGEVRKEIQADQVLWAVRHLVNQGARMIVVSLRHASLNSIHERRIKEFVRARYPEHYLRSVPLQLSTDVSDMPADYERTNTTLLNAYLHRDMARSLYRAEDRLRDAGFNRPLLIVHSSGGVARVAKTHALHTYSSGPAAGVVGASRLASLYGLPRVLTTDMGGTSLDVGLVVEGRYRASLTPRVDGIPLSTPMIEVESLGAGGGSIAWVDPSGRLAVGPQSAGAMPGPACYDKGGREATVTDADVVLGYIDPDYFLGGRQRLNKERARKG